MYKFDDGSHWALAAGLRPWLIRAPRFSLVREQGPQKGTKHRRSQHTNSKSKRKSQCLIDLHPTRALGKALTTEKRLPSISADFADTKISITDPTPPTSFFLFHIISFFVFFLLHLFVPYSSSGSSRPNGLGFACSPRSRPNPTHCHRLTLSRLKSVQPSFRNTTRDVRAYNFVSLFISLHLYSLIPSISS